MSLRLKSKRSWGRLGMKSEWKTKQLSDIADFNPRESLSKGIEAKKISMDMLQPFLKFGKPSRIAESFGGRESYMLAIKELEKELYKVG